MLNHNSRKLVRLTSSDPYNPCKLFPFNRCAFTKKKMYAKCENEHKEATVRTAIRNIYNKCLKIIAIAPPLC